MATNKQQVNGIECTETMFQHGVGNADVKLYLAAENALESGSIVESGNVEKGQYLVFDEDELIANFQVDESIKAVNFTLGWTESKERYKKDN